MHFKGISRNIRLCYFLRVFKLWNTSLIANPMATNTGDQ